jgi:phenolic acid decarboxylase
VIVYVYVPSSDDTIVTVFDPTVNAMSPHDEPDTVHVTPLTVRVPDENVGVSVAMTVTYDTDDVYALVVDANVDDSVNADVVAGDDVVPVTVTAVMTGDARVMVKMYVPSSDDTIVSVFEPTANAHGVVMVPLAVTATADALLH